MVCSSRVLGEQKYGYWMDVSWIGMYRSELAMGAWGLNLQICVIHHSSRVSFQNIMFHNVIIFQGAFVASENIDIIWIIYHNGAWSRLNLWIPNLPLLLRKHLCHQGENWTSREISANINWEQKSAPYIRLGFWDKNTSKKWDSSKHSDVTPPPKRSSTNLSVVHAVLKYSHIAFPAKTCFKPTFERCCTGQVATPLSPSDILKIWIDISTHPPEIVPKPSSKQVVWNYLNPS